MVQQAVLKGGKPTADYVFLAKETRRTTDAVEILYTSLSVGNTLLFQQFFTLGTPLRRRR